MLTQLRPARVLELGSGYSTAVALDESDTNPELGGQQITSVPARAAPARRPGSWSTSMTSSWPFGYPAHRLRQGRDWTQAYLLHAFLAGHTSWEISFFSSWFWPRQPGLIPQPVACENPGSIWLRKVR